MPKKPIRRMYEYDEDIANLKEITPPVYGGTDEQRARVRNGIRSLMREFDLTELEARNVLVNPKYMNAAGVTFTGPPEPGEDFPVTDTTGGTQKTGEKSIVVFTGSPNLNLAEHERTAAHEAGHASGRLDHPDSGVMRNATQPERDRRVRIMKELAALNVRDPEQAFLDWDIGAAGDVAAENQAAKKRLIDRSPQPAGDAGLTDRQIAEEVAYMQSLEDMGAAPDIKRERRRDRRRDRFTPVSED